MCQQCEARAANARLSPEVRHAKVVAKLKRQFRAISKTIESDLKVDLLMDAERQLLASYAQDLMPDVEWLQAVAKSRLDEEEP